MPPVQASSPLLSAADVRTGEQGAEACPGIGCWCDSLWGDRRGERCSERCLAPVSAGTAACRFGDCAAERRPVCDAGRVRGVFLRYDGASDVGRLIGAKRAANAASTCSRVQSGSSTVLCHEKMANWKAARQTRLTVVEVGTQ